ncbi:MAG: tetratricopeptide repeat protein [Rhodospirillales bacterium]
MTDNTPEIQSLLAEAGRAFQNGRLEEAESACDKLLKAAPGHYYGLQLMGFIRFSQGHADAAADCLNRASRAEPDNPEAFFNLGRVYEQLGRPDDAIDAYRNAHERDREDTGTLNALGTLLAKNGYLDDAESCFREAGERAPDDAALQVNLGNVLARKRDHGGAETCYRRAVALDDTLAPAHNGLAQALLALGETDAAMQAAERARNSKPDHAGAFITIGNIEKARARPDQAVDAYRNALARDPENPNAHFNLALALLLAGRLDEGWREYAWRWRWQEFGAPKRGLPQPEWNGGPFAGKRVIAWGEQGIGDEIMFASMLGDLAGEAASLTVECAPRLKPLFERSFPAIGFVARQDSPARELLDADADIQVATGSLGQRYRPAPESFPQRIGYLKADDADTSAFRARYRRLYSGKRLIGISWRSGNAELGAARTAGLDLWRPVLATPDCAFINLQYGDVKAELDAFSQQSGCSVLFDDSANPLENMDAFAAQIAALDLVISVDNSTVHLSGALGVPTWTLLPPSPDWRWMLEREDSPWYPAMRLFRQRTAGDWTEVFSRVADSLAAFKPDTTR